MVWLSGQNGTCWAFKSYPPRLVCGEEAPRFPKRANKKRMLAPSPYSYPARKILKVRFQQVSARDRCVNICDFGGWGAGEGGNLECSSEAKRDFPLPLLHQCRSLARVRPVSAPVMEAAEGPVTMNVEMVVDEVCCWLLNNGDWQWRPAATSLIAQHAMFEIRVSSRGTCFASKRILR